MQAHASVNKPKFHSKLLQPICLKGVSTPNKAHILLYSPLIKLKKSKKCLLICLVAGKCSIKPLLERSGCYIYGSVRIKSDLNEMAREGLILAENEGKRTFYSISERGVDFLRDHLRAYRAFFAQAGIK